MKKYFLQIIMGLAILFGLVLAITPYVAEYIFPKTDEEIQEAKSEDVARALMAIFQSPDADISDAHAIHKKTATTKTAWFSFRTTRKPMQRFIHSRHLEQKELSEEILNTHFFKNSPPAEWWHADLGTETYFTGTDAGNQLYLLYNSRTKRGVLVISSVLKNSAS